MFGKDLFKNYEKKVLETLVSSKISSDDLSSIIMNAELVDYEYTGSGYFLTVQHSSVPEQRIVCDKPSLMGEAGKIICGFIVFLENNELTIECHSWGEVEIPEDFRERDVKVQNFEISQKNG